MQYSLLLSLRWSDESKNDLNVKLNYNLNDNSFLGNLREALKGFTNPPFWGNKTLWQLDISNPDNNGFLNEGLLVWMRVSALPDFIKLYARVNHNGLFTHSLPKGTYLIEISYSNKNKC